MGVLFDYEGYEYFNNPPLSFLGNKRNFRKRIVQIVENLKIDENVIFVDVFGGSGYISHLIGCTLARRGLFNKIIWNDFDNFQNRLDNIETSFKLFDFCHKVLGDKYKVNQKISADDKQKILDYAQGLADGGEFVDTIQLSYFCYFSQQFINSLDKCKKASMFYKIPKVWNPDVSKYLAPYNIERVELDYKDLLQKCVELENQGKTLIYFCDPPYIQTYKDSYKNPDFTLRDYIYLIDFLKDRNFIFFTSEKSEAVALFDFMKIKYKISSEYLASVDKFLHSRLDYLLMHLDDKVGGGVMY